MANITVEQVDARLKEIVQFVNTAKKQIEELTQEYNQLLGYKQAILDMDTREEDTKVESKKVLNEDK